MEKDRLVDLSDIEKKQKKGLFTFFCGIEL